MERILEDLKRTVFRSIKVSMKVKTSITLSASTIKAIDELAGPEMARSRVIEQAVLEFVERRRRQSREKRDLEILNRSADRLK